MVFFQGTEYDDLVDAVHKLRRELPASRFNGSPVNLLVDVIVVWVALPPFSRREAYTARDEF